MAKLTDHIEEEAMASSLPEAARPTLRVMLDLLAELNGKIAYLDQEIARRAREDEVSRRLMTIPGIGPISATAIVALRKSLSTVWPICPSPGFVKLSHSVELSA